VELQPMTPSYDGSPVYNRGCPLVAASPTGADSAISLEYVAYHMPMIRSFMALARDEMASAQTAAFQSGAALPMPSEIFACYEAEESRMQKRLAQIMNDPDLSDAVNLYLDWGVYGNLVALENFTKALRVYHQALKDWSGNNLAAIHTIWSCNLFWEEGHDAGNLNASMIRERAIKLWKQTEELLSKEKIFANKETGINWPRLFENLGINLKFPRSTWPRRH
jgi:hypothetical protein